MREIMCVLVLMMTAMSIVSGTVLMRVVGWLFALCLGVAAISTRR